MNSFVHTCYPAEHPGVSRVESAVEAAREVRRNFDGGKSLAAMLLAAVVAALVSVADKMIDTWADGNLLVAWVLLWAVAFAALGLFAGTARSLSGRVIASLDAWSLRLAQARADERLWDIAERDPRVMAELQAAMSRNEESLGPVKTPAVAVHARTEASLAERMDAAFVRRARMVRPYI